MGFVRWPLDFGLCILVFGIQVKVFAKAQSPWTVGLEICILDVGVGTLDSGVWTLDFPLCALASDFGILVFGLCALD